MGVTLNSMSYVFHLVLMLLSPGSVNSTVSFMVC